MGCCQSKTDENQDTMFDPNEKKVAIKLTLNPMNEYEIAGPCLALNPKFDHPNEYEEIQETGSNQSLAGSFPTESKTESGEYEEPRKARKWIERIETNKDTIVLSVDPKADDEKIVKDREKTLMKYGRRFLLE